MHPAIEAFEEYWTALRKGAKAPFKADFDIADLPPKLWPYVTLVEIEQTPRRYKYTVFSTANRDAYGVDLTGLYMDEIDLGGNAEKYTAQFDDASLNIHPIYETDSYVREDGHRYGFEGGCYPLIGPEGLTSHLVLITALYRNDVPTTRW